MAQNGLKMNRNYRTVIGDFPKVGIRPVIDGRERGVRESLEKQTMGMALSAAWLISGNLRYPDGTPVECVISDTCIGGVAEAASCAEKFKKNGVGVSLTVTPCWCYGSETIDMDPEFRHPEHHVRKCRMPGVLSLCVRRGQQPGKRRQVARYR